MISPPHIIEPPAQAVKGYHIVYFFLIVPVFLHIISRYISNILYVLRKYVFTFVHFDYPLCEKPAALRPISSTSKK